MRQTPIAQLKARLSYYLDQVRHGQELIVTDRGRPIARISPVRGLDQSESRRDWLIRTGRLRPPIRPVDRSWRRLPRPADPEGKSLAALLEERAEGR